MTNGSELPPPVVVATGGQPPLQQSSGQEMRLSTQVGQQIAPPIYYIYYIIYIITNHLFVHMSSYLFYAFVPLFKGASFDQRGLKQTQVEVLMRVKHT